MSADGVWQAEDAIKTAENALWRAHNPETSNIRFSILVPVYRDDAARLVRALAACDGASETELIVYDDGSQHLELTEGLTSAILDYPGPAKLLQSEINIGRSIGRNRLFAESRQSWVLMLDADMSPPCAEFLRHWLTAVEDRPAPRAIFGGFILPETTDARAFGLHRAQSEASECLCADDRSMSPGKYVFTSNLMVHRDVLDAIAFDDGFKGWGWEDVDWGLRVAARFEVEHIDNPAIHLGLDTDQALIEKYARSAENFRRLAIRHPDTVKDFPVFKAAKALGRLPGHSLLKTVGFALAQFKSAPLRLRLGGLKVGRAAVYADALKSEAVS